MPLHDSGRVSLPASRLPKRRTDEERSSFLDAACGDNSRLRREIEALLRAHEGSFGLLDAPDRDLPTVDQPPITEGLGTLIGP